MAASFSHKLFALNAVVTVFIVGGTLSSPILDMFDGFGEQDGVVPEAVRRPPNVGGMAEVEAALGTVLGAATPAEGFRGLVSRQSTGAVTAGGSWAGVGVMQHQVHNVEGAGAELGEEEAGAPDADTEKDEEREQQAGWGRAARGRRQVVEDG